MVMEAGINVYSVHNQLNADYFGTLERIAEAGYRRIELIGFNTSDQSRFIDTFGAAEVGSRLRDLGLQPVSVHEGAAPGQNLDELDWDRLLAYYAQLDCTSIVLPSVWIQSREEALTTAEQMERIGRKLKTSGFRFYLHNHAHEFKRTEEGTLFDLLLQHTDPEHVRFELDMVWAMRGGQDPVVLLDRMGARCDIVHQKDLSRQISGPISIFEAMERDGQAALDIMEAYGKYHHQGDFVDLGQGVIDFAALYSRIKELGHVRYILAENESTSTDRFHSIANDLLVLNNFLQHA